jgi:hypothetical protein
MYSLVILRDVDPWHPVGHSEGFLARIAMNRNSSEEAIKSFADFFQFPEAVHIFKSDHGTHSFASFCLMIFPPFSSRVYPRQFGLRSSRANGSLVAETSFRTFINGQPSWSDIPLTGGVDDSKRLVYM